MSLKKKKSSHLHINVAGRGKKWSAVQWNQRLCWIIYGQCYLLTTKLDYLKDGNRLFTKGHFGRLAHCEAQLSLWPGAAHWARLSGKEITIHHFYLTCFLIRKVSFLWWDTKFWHFFLIKQDLARRMSTYLSDKRSTEFVSTGDFNLKRQTLWTQRRYCTAEIPADVSMLTSQYVTSKSSRFAEI